MTAGFLRVEAKAHLRELTGLRFLAAAAVVIYHGSFVLPLIPQLDWLAAQGHAGVSFFFILSGFVLTYTYADWFSAGISLPRYSAFLRARIARVYPMYLLALVLITPVVLRSLAEGATTARSASFLGLSWLSYAFLVQIYVPSATLAFQWNSPGWSIATEAAFYLCFPAVIACFAKWPALWRNPVRTVLAFFGIAVLGFAIACGAAWVLSMTQGDSVWTYIDLIGSRMPWFRLPEFVIGCALGLFYLSPRRAEHPIARVLSSRGGRNRVLLAALAAILLVAAITALPLPQEVADIRRIHWYLPFILPFAAIVLALAWGESAVSRVLSHPVLVLLGEASYSLYLINWSVIHVFQDARALGMPVNPTAGWLVLSLMVPASIVCFKVFETPMRRALRPKRLQTAGPRTDAKLPRAAAVIA